MAINISGSEHMPDAMADAHAVNPVKEPHTRLRVAECMRVNMGQAMTLAEFCQPVTDVSGKHGRTVLLWDFIENAVNAVFLDATISQYSQVST